MSNASINNQSLYALLLDISKYAFKKEEECIQNLLQYTDIFKEKNDSIKTRATQFVKKIRLEKNNKGVEGFISQFGLDNQEGIAIMCLAEALLRIPDKATANALINDKLGNGDWNKYISTQNSTFMTASMWGLSLTGDIIDLSHGDKSIKTTIGKLISKLGEPIMREALKKAMYILGNQFVIGESIGVAIKNAKKYEESGNLMSYDILGEGARTKLQAEFYLEQYLNAIETIGTSGKKNLTETCLFQHSGISIKLSALHPRHELAQKDRVMAELLPNVKKLIRAAYKHNIPVSIDAEESARLEISLMIFQELISDKEFQDFDGIGFVLQAYQKRAIHVLDYLAQLAKIYNKKFSIRLVKGAYWDSEIKHAQELGLKTYPVFTRKSHTDVSYLACVAKILENERYFYPQFATHNAQTVSSIIEIADGKKLEFQRLFGMGENFYNQLTNKYPVRIYAPVGKYDNLLPYLIRRLMENGANSSFVNKVIDHDEDIAEILRNPVKKADISKGNRNENISKPIDIYRDRVNSSGFDFGNLSHIEKIKYELERFRHIEWHASSIIDGEDIIHENKSPHKVYSPYKKQGTPDCKLVGKVFYAKKSDVDRAIDSAQESFKKWSKSKASFRSNILRKAATILEEKTFEAIAICIREAGKTIPDAVAEIRETIDFCRYYALQAELKLENPQELIGPTGEKNYLFHQGKGIFGCISPWNFPLAIFTGQVAAALASGNCVIAKPAKQTALIAYFMVKILHQAGIPRNVLHLLIGDAAKIGNQLVKDESICGIAFTGSTATAKYINLNLANRTGSIAKFIAETGGQNTMIMDSTSLPEQAVDDIILSAFGSSGQRCSALRVLYIQNDIADNMIELLKGAVSELKIGYPYGNFDTDVSSVIDEDAQKHINAHIAKMNKKATLIARAKAKDEHNELEIANGNFVLPHIFEINSINQLKEEIFGPVLHIIRYDSKDLEKIIQEINSTGYGLTFGAHSRIESIINKMKTSINAGNIYVNRSMIGATVGVHPFGGMGLSGTGPKAGGPNYLQAFCVEKTLSVNVTAIGGNIDLLNEGQSTNDDK